MKIRKMNQSQCREALAKAKASGDTTSLYVRQVTAKLDSMPLFAPAQLPQAQLEVLDAVDAIALLGIDAKATVSVIASTLGKAASTIRKHVAAMVADGLLSKGTDKGVAHYSVA
jgi:hypothetical protein